MKLMNSSVLLKTLTAVAVSMSLASCGSQAKKAADNSSSELAAIDEVSLIGPMARSLKSGMLQVRFSIRPTSNTIALRGVNTIIICSLGGNERCLIKSPAVAKRSGNFIDFGSQIVQAGSNYMPIQRQLYEVLNIVHTDGLPNGGSIELSGNTLCGVAINTNYGIGCDSHYGSITASRHEPLDGTSPSQYWASIELPMTGVVAGQ